MKKHSNYGSNLLHFYEYLKKQTSCHLTMGIGFSVVNPLDIERNLLFDIKMSDYSFESEDLNKYLENIPDELFHSYILNYNFNSLCIMNSRIITKYNDINKIKTIVFDSSTFKFLNNIKFIGLLYYLTLETNGEIYIETNGPFSHSFLIDTLQELYKIIKQDNKGFKFQSAYAVSNYILSFVPIDKMEDVMTHIWNREQIYSHNIAYLTKWFYGSKVELIEDDKYPITNLRYPIKKYYKITKELSHKVILDKFEENIKEFDEGFGLKSSSIVNLNILQ
jgi:hypothetical protein